MEKKIDILQKISQISTIPTLPMVIDRIADLLHNPQTSAEEIGKVISMDQALASKVLKLVNSAFYGFPGKISTITHAVVILGFSTIKNIVLTASILEMFKKSNKTMHAFDIEKFWIHSIACGVTAKVLASYIHCKQIEEYFIAGLIHDIGKIIFCQYLPKEFTILLNQIHQSNKLMYDVEMQLFKTTHQQIGGMITRQWNLPENLQHAVAFHHNPQKNQDYYQIISLVHCADIIVRAMNYGNGGDQKIPQMADHVWETFRLNRASLDEILRRVDEEVTNATIFMQI